MGICEDLVDGVWLLNRPAEWKPNPQPCASSVIVSFDAVYCGSCKCADEQAQKLLNRAFDAWLQIIRGFRFNCTKN